MVEVESEGAPRKGDTGGGDGKPPEEGLVVTCCLGKARLGCHSGCHGLVRHGGRRCTVDTGLGLSGVAGRAVRPCGQRR